jgi:Rod binding domain-containing protein
MADTLTQLLGQTAGRISQPAIDRSQVPQAVVEAAENFESIFLSQFLETMTKDLQGESFGGGDNPLTGLIKNEYASLISKSGGIGVADAVLREMLKIQEVS